MSWTTVICSYFGGSGMDESRLHYFLCYFDFSTIWYSLHREQTLLAYCSVARILWPFCNWNAKATPQGCVEIGQVIFGVFKKTKQNRTWWRSEAKWLIYNFWEDLSQGSYSFSRQNSLHLRLPLLLQKKRSFEPTWDVLKMAIKEKSSPACSTHSMSSGI